MNRQTGRPSAYVPSCRSCHKKLAQPPYCPGEVSDLCRHLMPQRRISCPQADALFVDTHHRMLETRGVGGVSRDGNIDLFMMHDSHTFTHIIRAITTDRRSLSCRIGLLSDNLELAGGVIKLGLNVGETIDP